MRSIILCNSAEEVIVMIERDNPSIDYIDLTDNFLTEINSFGWLTKMPIDRENPDFLYFNKDYQIDCAKLLWTYLLKQQEKKAS